MFIYVYLYCLECKIYSIIKLMSLGLCAVFWLYAVLSNFLWEKSLPLDLRCCWINHPIILLGLTPPNLPHDTCRPVAGPNPLYHTSRCHPQSWGAQEVKFDKWQLGNITRLWFSVQGVDPGQQKWWQFEPKHHLTKSQDANQRPK